MGLFACSHGRYGDCRTCDIVAAEERTAAAVERQTAAVEATATADAQREVQRRAEQEARDRADAEARREARVAREAQEQARLRAEVDAEVDRQIAYERELERQEEERARRDAEDQSARDAFELSRRVERALAVAETEAMAEGRTLTPVQRLDVRDAVEAEVEAERGRLRRLIAEREAARQAQERAEREAREAAEREERARQRAEQEAREREAARLAAIRAAEDEERARIRAHQQSLIAATKKRLMLGRNVFVGASVALSVYATWVDLSSVFALAGAAVLTLFLYEFYDGRATDREQGGRYSGAEAAGALAFAVSCELVVRALPWHHPTPVDHLLLAVAAGIAVMPLVYRSNHVPQITPGTFDTVVIAPLRKPEPHSHIDRPIPPVPPVRRG
ncbi:hypothetical protein [Geodermatophilus amargosae]|uniref:hypothetical protein n=1 Tax=Geodermatophilus amargosae TaxID=1296565 RepID=UPI0034DE4D37